MAKEFFHLARLEDKTYAVLYGPSLKYGVQMIPVLDLTQFEIPEWKAQVQGTTHEHGWTIELPNGKTLETSRCEEIAVRVVPANTARAQMDDLDAAERLNS